MRRSLGCLVPLVILAGAVWLLWPTLRGEWDRVRRAAAEAQRRAALLAAPAPTALPNPVPGAALTDTWGGARSQGRKHEGIDIFAKRNTPIRATTEGVVLNVGPNGLGGRTVMILGPGGQRHYYAHLERYPDLKSGDWVKAGDVVGTVGDSGNARGTPPHLHYGIYMAGGAINPYSLLRRGN
ncbi:M23 family metallopeptidase [Deinococcus taklimakanensis]|uniref:M23 family metallopeptidase n=1 Tax=Deinococcus taklimakanensis TaxID=536443 RepID=A0ABW5P866_9DEIO